MAAEAVIGLGPMSEDSEESEDGLDSEAKAEAGRRLASALGVKGDVDGKAVCEAVKEILDLEAYGE